MAGISNMILSIIFNKESMKLGKQALYDEI